MAAFGLRAKSFLALVLACLLALVPALLIGGQVLKGIHQHFGEAYARNATQLNRERIFAPISRELALSLRFANSEVTRQWLLDEQDPDKHSLFFREAEGYRQAFRDHAYFIVNTNSLDYYFNGGDQSFSDQPRYRMSPDNPDDRWFFGTLESTSDYNINVDSNPQMNTTRVWLNMLIRNDHKVIGIAGSGIDLSNFISDFIASELAGVSPMILDRHGAIQAHQNPELIALNSGADGAAQPESLVFSLLGSADQAESLRQAMQQAEQQPDQVQTLRLQLQGREQLLALGFIPELGWHVVNAVDLNTAEVINRQWLWPLVIGLAGLILVLVLLFALGTERLLLRPLRQLRQSAQALAAGNYDVRLPKARNDEIGELSSAFGSMAARVRENTQQLESRVQERTRALEEANRDMANAHKKIGDSIDYASLIQRAILPNRELVNTLGDRHAVLWRPRDVVGGDFYIFRNLGQHYLLGVVDCAGHGVPGALMTMLAHAALDQAISDCGPQDPAAVLQRTDQIVRNMLGDTPEFSSLATNMDVGLAFVDIDQRKVTFAGAKIALYFSDGNQVEHLPGGRRALVDKRQGQYHNTETELLSGRTFYLCTDGFLDQAGGELGFGFGNSRFAEMLREHACLPLEQQSAAFSATLAAYQGSYPQRDDITMLCFRFD